MNFVHPVKNPIVSSSYGSRIDPFTGKLGYHKGLDYKIPSGTEVFSSEAGTVLSTGFSKDLGNFVLVNHENSFQTLYGHLTQSIVKAGDKIEKNSLIAYSGNTGRVTGSHLHFAIKKNNQFIDPSTVLTISTDQKKTNPLIFFVPILFFLLSKK